ncbi:MAG: PLD nuclease N-terminal domain-containing protein [Acidimicrobiia bacterium]|nr:PLD nuclease N-terminal domain-containing protein [Acidimicrobiia bacterium]
MSPLVAALLPLVLLGIAWIAYCLADLRRSDVEHLPKWGWALVIVLSVPLGGVVYLVAGRNGR